MDKWKMVPVEPTAAMASAGSEQEWTEDVYRAMLAAAPAPAFDETAERVAALENWRDFQPDYPDYPSFASGWLACAKRKAGVL